MRFIMAPIVQPAPRQAPAVLLVAAICGLIETFLTLAAMPPFSSSAPREALWMYGAFWPGLLRDWEPIYPGQPALMFLSYSFLHGGFLHMAMNMLILVHLARETVARVGQWGFILFFLLTSATGGAVYALLSSMDAPMLGASGAVFGLFGATAWWDIQRRRVHGQTLQPVLRMMGGLAVMNVLLFFLVGGMLAWQTHLGGFIGGLVLARVVTPTPGHRWRG